MQVAIRDTNNDITVGQVSAPAAVGDTVTVQLHDGNGMPVVATGEVVEVLEQEDRPAYTYKQETKRISTSLLNPVKREITQYVIRDADGNMYAEAPADWTEDDVAAAVKQLNDDAQAEAQLRAELGEEGYAQYRDQEG